MKKWQRLLGVTGAVLIGCVLLGSFAAPSAPHPAAVSATVSTTAAQGYVIAESKGRVAVFRRGDKTPLYVTDTLVRNLPRADAERLRRGIAADDEDKLHRMLEDFCS